MQASNLQRIREKKINMILVVLMALFDKQMETIEEGARKIQVVPA